MVAPLPPTGSGTLARMAELHRRLRGTTPGTAVAEAIEYQIATLAFDLTPAERLEWEAWLLRQQLGSGG